MSKKSQWINVPNFLGLLGIIFSIIATQTPDPFTKQCFFLAAVIPLFTSACLMRHRLFLSLEGVLFMGVLLGFFSLSPWISGGLPIAASLILIGWFLKSGRIQSFNDWMGIISLVMLSVGFAIQAPFFYLVGALIGTFYSALEVRQKVYSAWIWVILNAVFALAVLIEMLGR